MQTHTCVYGPAGRESLKEKTMRHALTCAIINIPWTHVYIYVQARSRWKGPSAQCVHWHPHSPVKPSKLPLLKRLVFFYAYKSIDTHIHIYVFLTCIYRLIHSPGKSTKLALVKRTVSSSTWKYICAHVYAYTFSANIYRCMHSPAKSRKLPLLKRIVSS